ncbi:unnamed protein product [Triticum turgidum subsp. durum]|uniref:Vitamin K epoxide reductase domain-containing protein n=1 Tax=Triticum turgidum subsp. durum TaxID=4567 RepID=A0A9R0U2M7_TRITD|nr:unnamed protein product [Triticum turgidum subsp. durum]
MATISAALSVSLLPPAARRAVSTATSSSPPRVKYVGIPLPLVGMVTYGVVTALSLQENGEELLPGLDDLDIRLTLLLLATSLATASAYFLFILNTKFVGTSCLYCLSSAFISFTLFFIRLKDIGLARIQKFVGLQLAVAVIVALALTNSYSSATTQLKGTGDFVLEPYKTELFGREAMEILDYVECFPNGAGKGKKMANECVATGLEGFPTWVINGKLHASSFSFPHMMLSVTTLRHGLPMLPKMMKALCFLCVHELTMYLPSTQLLSGDQELSVLAEESGFVSESPEQS